MSEVIRHNAFVKSIDKNSLWVTIVNESACSACHAKGACNISDFQEKEIEISIFKKQYSPGDEVTIIFKESTGFKAVFFGYIFPFLVLFITLVISLRFTNNEGFSGLLALGVLIPYYTALYLFRQHLKKFFKFEIEETD